MKNNITVALVISTYNWPKALELVLLSVKNQDILPCEVIIADDGSTDETKTLISSFQKSISIPIRHFWHEDQGFRKSLILNIAIANSTAAYIIQIDGDCILHKKFIGDHLNIADKKKYLYGSRVSIQKSYLETLFKIKKTNFNIFSSGIKKRTRALCIPILGKFYRETNKLSHKFRGCNVSFWKEDFVDVNGYNEDFKGWGREDSELIVRMINNDILGKRLRYCGILFHIFHIERSRNKLNFNDKIQQNSIEKKLTWCTNGIDKHIN